LRPPPSFAADSGRAQPNLQRPAVQRRDFRAERFRAFGRFAGVLLAARRFGLAAAFALAALGAGSMAGAAPMAAAVAIAAAWLGARCPAGHWT
jgi:hypothetical protein